MSPAIAGATNYGARCSASIMSVVDNDGKPVDEFRLKGVDGARPYLDRLKEMFSAGRKFVHVRIRNEGKVPLYGYEPGLNLGLASMTHKVIDEAGNTTFQGTTVHVSGVIEPG